MRFGRTQKRNSHKHQKKYAVIQRPYSQTSPGVEILEILIGFLGVEKNSRNQEAGQHKEKINSHPAVSEQTLQVKRGVLVAGVNSNHHQNRQTPNCIELRDFLVHFRFARHVCADHDPALTSDPVFFSYKSADSVY
jgi:hypothetical protein